MLIELGKKIIDGIDWEEWETVEIITIQYLFHIILHPNNGFEFSYYYYFPHLQSCRYDMTYDSPKGKRTQGHGVRCTCKGILMCNVDYRMHHSCVDH